MYSEVHTESHYAIQATSHQTAYALTLLALILGHVIYIYIYLSTNIQDVKLILFRSFNQHVVPDAPCICLGYSYGCW